MEQQPAPRDDFFQLLAAEAEGPVSFALLAAGRDAARGVGRRRLRDGRVRGPGVVLSLGCEISRVDGVGVAATGQYTNLPTRGHPRSLIRFNWHATRVAAIEFAAIRVEIWIRRRERLLIEDELTSVGISGRGLLVCFQACPKRRPGAVVKRSRTAQNFRLKSGKRLDAPRLQAAKCPAKPVRY